MNNKYFICYYLHTVLLKKMLIIHKFLWNQVKQLLKKIYITKPFTVYFRKLGLGLVLLWFVDDLLRGSNLQISCTHEFLAPFLKEMDFSLLQSPPPSRQCMFSSLFENESLGMTAPIKSWGEQFHEKALIELWSIAPSTTFLVNTE